MKKYFIIPAIAFTALFATSSCSEWDDHYDEANIASTSNVDVYNCNVGDYIKSDREISKMAALFESAGIISSLDANQSYTFIVCSNSCFNESKITDGIAYAKYCTADMALAPSVLKDGFGIQTRLGKQIWVKENGDSLTLDGANIKKTVKTNNGYVYIIDDILTIHPSAYEYLLTLGDEYSTFKNLVTSYDYKWFDKENSTVIGIAQDGSTLYDSVIVIRNTLMDRYYVDGQPMWNMRDEQYNS
ncbi:MAG: fasciclin domain-containing protein, partial [Prevotella sp.]